MDLLSYFLAKKYTDKAVEAKVSPATTAIEHNLDGSVGLILNELRQHEWANTAEFESLTPLTEEGTVTLQNTLVFPFNNSAVTVALTNKQSNTKYFVIAEVTSAVGNPGELVVSDKLTNGFKISYTGSASSVSVKYSVVGGVIK